MYNHPYYEAKADEALTDTHVPTPNVTTAAYPLDCVTATYDCEFKNYASLREDLVGQSCRGMRFTLPGQVLRCYRCYRTCKTEDQWRLN